MTKGKNIGVQSIKCGLTPVVDDHDPGRNRCPDQQPGRRPDGRRAAGGTGTVMKAACGAVLGSGTTLMQ